MELKSATCPNCGGSLKLDPSNERGTCPFCKSEIIVTEAIQKFKGEVEGIATQKSRLTRAEQMLEGGDFDGAMKSYKLLLEASPENHEAWWGLFNCDVTVAEYYLQKDGHSTYNVRKYIVSLQEAINQKGKWALEYAPSDKRVDYEAGISRVQNKIQSTVIPEEKNSGCCYIATSVYGSYDAPEVLCLRRFRDEVLEMSFFGRLFIRIYYWISPPIAERLKNAGIINSFVRGQLDRFVNKLNEKPGNSK